MSGKRRRGGGRLRKRDKSPWQTAIRKLSAARSSIKPINGDPTSIKNERGENVHGNIKELTARYLHDTVFKETIRFSELKKQTLEHVYVEERIDREEI